MEELKIKDGLNREDLYRELMPQIKALVEGEEDVTANLSNITAALKQAFGFFWVGFYLIKKGELVLGPFQGPVACTRIGYGKGVCGTAWKNKETIIVPEVDKFPGHIACNAASRSEIVVPVFKNEEVAMVLDIDSDRPDDFDDTDKKYLTELSELITSFL